MKRTVLTFGLITGAVFAAMLAMIPFSHRIGFGFAEILGYTTLVVSALMVFFGVRSYRENAAGGHLTFGRGFAVGILITLIFSICYVATWEFVFFKFTPDFADKYADHMVARARASGATAEKIQKSIRDAEEFKVNYRKPLYNVAETFIEVFPTGLAATLISAAILRRKSLSPAI
jgi:hypothetical protein